MRKTLKWVPGVLAAVFVVFQVLRVYPPGPKTNPPADEARTIEAHPASWFLINHVNHGRQHLNLSDWTQLHRHGAKAGAEEQLAAICREVQDEKMPPKSYLLIHRSARLSREDAETICGWTRAEEQRLVAAR